VSPRPDRFDGERHQQKCPQCGAPVDVTVPPPEPAVDVNQLPPPRTAEERAAWQAARNSGHTETTIRCPQCGAVVVTVARARKVRR
jgi:endogenous inhibitor of DNA gyrase (YacG/DUF329 family)